MSLPYYIERGTRNLRIEPYKLARPARSIHSLILALQNESATAHAYGSAPDGWSNMRIVQNETENDGPIFIHRLLCEGIAGEETFLELDLEDDTPEAGWDSTRLRVFTREPDAARWARGSQYLADDLTGVTAEADDDKLTKAAHGLVTGQRFKITFASGFTGLTSGSYYFAIRIDADTLKAASTKALALAGTAINITADGTDATLTPTVHGYDRMWIVDRQVRRHRARDYYELDLTLRGLREDKPGKRSYSGSAQSTASKFPGLTIFSADIYTGFPPVDSGSNASLTGTDIPIEYDVPQGTLNDIFVSETNPADHLSRIGQFWTPDNAPTITYFTLYGEALTYHIPWGWKCVNIQAEQLAGLSIWLWNITWVYQRATTPTTAPAD